MESTAPNPLPPLLWARMRTQSVPPAQQHCPQRESVHRAAGLGFLLLFPGFFVYQALVAAQIIPPVLAGGMGVLAFISLIALAVGLARSREARRAFLTPYTVLLCAWLTLGTVWSATHVVLGPGSAAVAAATQVSETFGYLTTLYLVGRFLPVTHQRFRSTAIVSALLMIGYVIGVAAAHSEVFIYSTPAFQRGEGVASYQGIARSIFVVAVTGLVLAISIPSRVALSVGGIVALYLVGARSEFVAMLLSVASYWALFLTRSARAWIALFIVAALSAVAATAIDWDGLSRSRQFQLLDISTASSWLSRTELQAVAIQAIQRNPGFGDFTSHVTQAGSTGAYAHNVLSAWTVFGFVGFAIYILLNVGSAVIAWSAVRRSRYAAAPVLTLILSSACLLLLVSTKSVFWILPGLVWGLASNLALRSERRVAR